MKINRLVPTAILLLAALAPACAADNYLVLDGNRNPLTFRSKDTGSGQIQQSLPSDPTGLPYSLTNPQYFNLLLGGAAPTLGQSPKAGAITMAPPSDPDVRPAPGTISAVDAGTVTNTGQSGATITTGAPSLNSSVLQAVNGLSGVRLQLSGTWSGTIAFEQSIDGGITYGMLGCHVNGTVFSLSAVTGNGIFDCEGAGATHIRARASAWTSGNATVTQTITASPGVLKILNSVALKDNASGAAATIKPASTAAVATDPAVVVTISPNNPFSLISGATSSDAGGTIATGGSYQTIIAANSTRKGCFVQNPTTAVEVLNVKFGTMAQPVTLLPGMSIGCAAGLIVLTDAVTVMGATLGHAFVALAQ